MPLSERERVIAQLCSLVLKLEYQLRDFVGNEHFDEELSPETLGSIKEDPEQFYQAVINTINDPRIKLIKAAGTKGTKYFIRLSRSG